MAHLYLKGPTVKIAAMFCSLFFISYSYCVTDTLSSVEADLVQETDSVSALDTGSATSEEHEPRETLASMRTRPAIVQMIKPIYLPRNTKLEIMSDVPLNIRQVKLSSGGILRMEIFNATTSLPDTITIDKGILRSIAFETKEDELVIYVSLTEPVIYEVESTDQGVVVVFQNPLLERLVSINVDDESISTVLLMLFMQYGANIVAGSNVTGSVTAHLVDVPLKKALDEILGAEGYGYVEENGLIRVLTADEMEERKAAEAAVSPESMAAVETESRIFELNFADVKDIQSMLQELIGREGTILADQRTNSLIVVVSPKDIARIEEIIAQLDKEIPEDRIIPSAKSPGEVSVQEEVAEKIIGKVFRLNYISPEKASAILQPFLSEKGAIQVIEEEKERASAGGAGAGRGMGMSGGSAGAGMQLGEAVGKGGYIVVSDTEEIIREIEQEISKIDVPVPQVEIEAYIVEGALSNDSELGIDWTAVNKDEDIELSFSRDMGGILTKGIITADKFIGVMNALSTSSELNVLSNPRITTLEDQPAVFHSGDKIPYSRIIIQDGIEQVDTVFEDVGIVLTATPHVKENDIISLLLATSVSSEGGFTPTGQPRIATRTTQSQVLVKSGDTVVIAGLISKKASMAVSKVPIVGDIPLIGRVFSTEREVEQKSEVTIFITPRIIVTSL